MKSSRQAFHWIVKIFRQHRVPFRVTGGLAARIYGSPRPLADIDFDVPEERWPDFAPDVKDHLVFGPARYRDAHWDLFLLTLRYGGQLIDIGSLQHVRVFNQTKQAWVTLPNDFNQTVNKKVFGLIVPVISRVALLRYKKKLRRKVDLADVKALTRKL